MKDRIRQLYRKYLSKNISREEYEELFDLIGNDNNLHLVEEIVDDSLSEEIITSGRSPFKQHNTGISLSGTEHNTGISRRIFYRISAAATILILVVALFFVFKSPTVEWVILRTGFQETKNVQLPDGSEVIMNANSELKWKKGFEKKKERTVEFTGEAYFDVAHLSGKSFVVRSGSVDVNVLGTEFNLETRRHHTNVFLKEGKVVLKGENMEPIEMIPGDLVHYDAERKKVKKISDQQSVSALSWKEGVFTFVDLTGIQILEKMEDIYGKNFIIVDPGKLKDVIVVQGLPYTDWNFTREALELALEVKFTDSTANTIIVKTKNNEE